MARFFINRPIVAMVISIIMVILGVIAMVSPIVFMISTSLKQQMSVFVLPPQWIPSPVQWHNYADVFDGTPFDRRNRERRASTWTRSK